MAGFVDLVEVDLIVNGRPEGRVATSMMNGQYETEARVGFDYGLLRPVVEGDGKKYLIVNTGRKDKEGKVVRKHVPLQTFINNGMVPFTFNASALPYQAWQRIDAAVLKASRDRLNAWNDLAAANTYGGFDGMAITGLLKDTMTDFGDAKVDMETLTDDMSDSGLYQPDILPLPIIHAGVVLPQRRLATSRNAGTPLDTTSIEQCGTRCSETLEKMTIGITDFSGVKIAQSQQVASADVFTNQGIYGFRTQGDRITKTDVTASASFVAETFLNEVLAMIELARAQKIHGPFVLYYSTAWDQYLDRDYFVYKTSGGAAPSQTVRQRVTQIEKIQRVAMLDMFTSSDELLLVQMTSETVRAVNGMEFVTVQWTEDGGAKIMLRVMGIKVPDLRSQYVGTSTSSRKCGIVHGTTS